MNTTYTAQNLAHAEAMIERFDELEARVIGRALAAELREAWAENERLRARAERSDLCRDCDCGLTADPDCMSTDRKRPPGNGREESNVTTTTDSQVDRLRRQIEELEHDQERFEEVVVETWGAAGGGDVADLATLCDRLPYRVEQLLSRVRLLEAALREYQGLPWVEELPDSYHAFTDKVNKLLDEDAPEEPSIIEAVCEALSHLDHITHGNAEYNPDALAAAASLRRAFGNV